MGTGPVAATLARTAQRKASSLFAPTWRSTVSSCPGETRATSALVCCPSRRSSSSSLSARLSCARQVSSLACLLAASSRRPLATPRPPPSSLHLPSPSSGSRRSRSRSTAQLCFPCSPSTLLSLVRPLATSQPRLKPLGSPSTGLSSTAAYRVASLQTASTHASRASFLNGTLPKDAADTVVHAHHDEDVEGGAQSSS